MKKRIGILVGVVILILAFKCCTKTPEFIAVENVEVTDVIDSVLVVQMDYKAYNPNPIKVTLINSEVDVFFEDIKMGHGVATAEVELRSGDTIRVPIQCRLNLKKIAAYFPRIMEVDTTSFDVKGYGEVNTPIGDVKFKVQDVIQLNMKEVLKEQVHAMLIENNDFTLQKIQWSQSLFGSAKVKAEVVWKNPFPFDFKIINRDFELILGKRKKIGEVISDQIIEVKADNNVIISVEINIDQSPSMFFESGLSALMNQKIELTTEGIVTVEIKGYSFDLPISSTKEISSKGFLK